jgi:hypothetical protein
MTGPTFSIILPTFNRRELVGKAIESALRQTFTDFELVVSDNHSTDDTRSVIEQFDDPRVRYVRPPEHCILPEHWEFVRRQATGELVLLLGDDDALVESALEHFAAAQREHDADLLFSTVAEYLDPGFTGPSSNLLVCFPFTGKTSVVDADQLLGRLFARLDPTWRMDPSAFVFSQALADRIAAHTGYFFHTQGAEYFSWPLAGALAERIVHVSLPLVMTGRTPKSWGTNMVLVNGNQQKIDAFLSDVTTRWHHSPVTNFTCANMMVEGMLTAKAAWPEALQGFEMDEQSYLQVIYQELLDRRSKGADAEAEIAELERYVASDPRLQLVEPSRSFTERAQAKARRSWARTRSRWIGNRAGYKAPGALNGFGDILGAADFVARSIREPSLVPVRAQTA